MALEAARDAGRKYGLTLLLLYQLVGPRGREGARAWYDDTSWRLYAALQDPGTARELSHGNGEHGAIASSEGSTRGTSGHWGCATSSSSGQSTSRFEMRRPLIKPEQLLQDTRADEAFIVLCGAKPLRCGRAFFCRPNMAKAVAPSRFQPTAPPAPARSGRHVP